MWAKLKNLPTLSSRSMDWVAVSAILVVAFLVVLTSQSRGVNLYDEGVILTAAARVLSGDVIHRDFYANYGPAQFYLLALLFKAFGPSVLVARLWGTIIKAAIVALIYVVARRIMPTPWAIACSVFSLVWLALVDFTIWPAWPALLLVIASIHFLCGFFARSSGFASVFAAGACTGVAALFRYDIGFMVCAAEVLVLSAFAFTRPGVARPWHSALYAVTIFLAGVAVPCLPVAVGLLLCGAIKDLIFQVLIFPAHNYAATRGLPFPFPVPGRRPFTPIEYIVYFPLTILFCAFLAILPRRQSSRRDAPSFQSHANAIGGLWQLTLLGAITLALFGKGIVRVGSLHMTLAVVPAMIILGGLLVANSRRRVSIVFTGFLAIALIHGVVLSLDAYRVVSARIAANVSHFTGHAEDFGSPDKALLQADSCQPASGLERVRCFKYAIDHQAAVQFVRKNTTSADTIFVGLPQHERIFANNVAFYFVADRRPATKWHHFDPGLQNTSAIQELIVKDLERSKPPYVILDSEWERWREPNRSAISSGVKLLDSYIENNYVGVAQFGSLKVLQASKRPLVN